MCRYPEEFGHRAVVSLENPLTWPFLGGGHRANRRPPLVHVHVISAGALSFNPSRFLIVYEGIMTRLWS
jgi:hypothetical protein